MLRNCFSLNHLSMATSKFLTHCGQGFSGVMFVYESKIERISKKCSENFIESLSHSKNGMAKCVITKKFFRRF